MKAVRLKKYGSPADLQLMEVDKPVPGDDEVLVRVRAASVNDWDWGLVRGKPYYIRLLCGLFAPKVEIPGVDIAGEVEAVGKNAGPFSVGDAVCGDLSAEGFGGFAEYVCAPPGALTGKPDNMSYAEAAALPHAALLALQGLRKAGTLDPEIRLLINGAGGGMGTLGIQIARALGIKHVTGVDGADKFEMMRRLDFDHLIDYRTEDFTRSGERYDLILDAKTNRSIFRYLRVLKPGGSYITVGGLTSRLISAVVLAPFIRRFTGKQVQLLALHPNDGMSQITEWCESGDLKPVIDGPFDLADTAKAIQHFGSGRHQGKVVITVG